MRRFLTATLILGMASAVLANDIRIAETDLTYPDIQSAVNAATAGQTIRVAAGTYAISSPVNVNKAVTIKGDGAGTVLEVSGTGPRFSITAAGAALESVQIKKTDKAGVQNIIYIGASNVSIKNNLIWGQYNVGDADTTRAMEIAGGLTGLLIEGNTIHNLRQPAYINGSAGTIRNNYLYATKGWVICNDSQMTLEGNTWGSGAQANAVDIAIIVQNPSVPSPAFYGNLVQVWSANNHARIDDQRSPAYIKYVDAANGNDTTGSGGADKPYATIAKAINTVAAGGGVVVAPGNYGAVGAVAKSVSLLGANAGIHPAVGKHATETVGTRGAESILAGLNPQADNITIDGFKFSKAGTRIIDTYANANNFHLTNCIVESTAFGQTTGVIQFGGGSHVGFKADFNLLQDLGDHTFYFGGGPYDGLNLSYNRINVAGDAVFWSATPLVDGVIEGNEFDGTIGGIAGTGFCTVNIGQGGNIAIRNNWCHDVLYTPFQVGIVNGSVVNNTFERIYPYSTYGANAFELWGGQWGTAVSSDVTIDCNTFSYNDLPATAPVHAIRLRAPETGTGIDGATIHIHNNVFRNGGAMPNAFAIRHQGNPATTVDADNNWWGLTTAASIGLMVSGNVDFDPYLTTPPDCQANVLYLEPVAASIYVKPSETVTVNMNVANLAQPVNGCQALLNFSSSFFKAGTGEVTVAAGGGLWTELLYSMWNVAGDLDVAVGVDLTIPGGTNADAKIAYMTLTPTGVEGTTRVVFRADGESGYATMLSDLSANPVWPIKIDSANIVIDGTAPTITAPDDAAVTVAQYSMIASATDALAGIESFTMNGVPFTSPTQLTLVPGANTFTFQAIDRAGNATTKVVTITYNQPAPAITVYHAIAPNASAGQSSYNAWLANELQGVLTGSPSVGSGYAAWQVIADREVDYAAAIVTPFHSWMGLITSDLEWGNRATYVYKLDNGVQTNPGAAKLNLDKVNVTWKWNYAAADSLPADPSYDFSYSWQGKAGTFAAGVQRLKGYNWVDGQWVEVTSGREADMIIYNNGEGYEPESATPAKPATQATLNELYKQMCGAIAFQGSNREKVADSNFVVAYAGHAGVADATTADVGFKYKTVDAIAPVVTITIPADGAKLNNAALTITGTATDNETLASGIRSVQIKLNGTEVYLNTTQDNVSFTKAVTLAEGPNTIQVVATDFAGNETSTSRTVLLDTAAPMIGNLTAVQDVDVLNCANVTLQGVVNISVDAGDASAGLVVPPAVTVTSGSETLTVTYAGESPAGTFNYTVNVAAATSNGTWTITATATDEAGNTANVAGTLCVNKNQVTGTVSFATLKTTAYSVTRDVVFVATDDLGAVLNTWTIAVQFTNASEVASGSYTLTDVPDGIKKLSAKTAWQLRKRQAVSLDANGQTVANFVLLGGDVKEDNFVNILDYSVLKGSWNTTNAAADINGDGTVGTLDYTIQKNSWFQRGDEQ